MSETLYNVLGIPEGASADHVKSAYRLLAMMFHPDRLSGMSENMRRQAEERLKAINAAYAVLRDPAKRASYDAELAGRRGSWVPPNPPRPATPPQPPPRAAYTPPQPPPLYCTSCGGILYRGSCAQGCKPKPPQPPLYAVKRYHPGIIAYILIAVSIGVWSSLSDDKKPVSSAPVQAASSPAPAQVQEQSAPGPSHEQSESKPRYICPSTNQVIRLNTADYFYPRWVDATTGEPLLEPCTETPKAEQPTVTAPKAQPATREPESNPLVRIELARLRSGFTIRHCRRLVMGGTTRLYLSPDNSSFTDVPTAEITGYEKDLSGEGR